MWLVIAGCCNTCLAGEFVNVTLPAVPASGGTLKNAKAAWADYDNDGWVDVSVGGTLLRNNRNGTFHIVQSTGGDSIWGDYNNDGLLDLFQYAAVGGSGGVVWHNMNGESFAPAAPLPDMPPNSRGATWGDFNGDKYLDLYVGGYENFPSAYYSDVIYTNNQNGTFSQTWEQGIDSRTTPGRPRPARGVATADWDQDNDLDIYVSNYRIEPNALYRNDGSGTFVDVASAKNALATSPGYYGGHSIGSAWGDFDNDGLIDLFAGNFSHPGQPQSRFLKNNGPDADFTFTDKGTGGVSYQESYASPTVGDFDNDGDLDLYLTTVYPIASGGVANFPTLYRNDGNFNFVDVTTEWGLPKSGSISTYQAAFADYDNDGYLDLVTDGKLYRNTGGENNFLKVRLLGAPLFDATAIGAQVRIALGDKIITRQVEGAVGEGNQNDQTLHFGLGDYTGLLNMQITWPNGATQSVDVSGVDQILTVAPTPFHNATSNPETFQGHSNGSELTTADGWSLDEAGVLFSQVGNHSVISSDGSNALKLVDPKNQNTTLYWQEPILQDQRQTLSYDFKLVDTLSFPERSQVSTGSGVTFLVTARQNHEDPALNGIILDGTTSEMLLPANELLDDTWYTVEVDLDSDTDTFRARVGLQGGSLGEWSPVLDMLNATDGLPIRFLANDTVQYDNISLSAASLSTTALLSGDFNSDGMVDGADFLTWQRGDSPSPLSSDDLSDWQSNYAMPSGSSLVTVVPEPAVHLLLALPLFFRRRAGLRQS
ncbi:CRTAC1 family protein [Adhaeretor mobilis]|uniref:CRTAC1 family protein n=1 Tax=Adhaeretor mobilis TaxID=1930276 RepID=UPI001C54DA51|nr:CRTAC1 family protein [Adhaeretor mobilis]